VTGFVEYNLAVPLGASNLTAPDDSSVSVGQVMAETLGLGIRVTALQDITFNAAFNIGLAETVAFGIPATMPWNFIFGVAYNVDPFAAGHTKVVERTYQHPVVQEAAAATGKVEGFVLDANTGKPVPGALVAFANQDNPPVATDTSRGRFLSYDLPAGNVDVTVTSLGYHSGTASATVEVGKIATVEVKLVPELKPATVRVSLTSNGAPVTGTVQVTGDATATIQAVGAGNTQLPPGNYSLAVTADGYQPQAQQLSVAAGDDRTVTFEMVSAGGTKNQGVMKKAAKPLVLIVKNRIVIKQQVHFAKNKAVILKDSYTLLDQVAEAIKTNDLKKVEVGGHTDNQGDKDANLKLSDDRANAVRTYLVKSGIEASRLTAQGYGDTKPIAPNMTAKGRELNRRVEFNILEK
jgi:outer membrane protein OmpA-like peptidoglycan-associated protein